jgi:tetratricopeptide (TPR) repeat protein
MLAGLPRAYFMHKNFGHLSLIFAFWGFSQPAQAMTASQVYEKVSNSIVVVYGLDENGKGQTYGSGVVIPGGAVVTNCHVIDMASAIKVNYQKKSYPAVAQYIDLERDVCTLVPKGLVAPSVGLGNTDNLKIGERVYAIGAPKGLELTLSEGIISSLRNIDGDLHIQHTAPISRGSSGGGLFDEEAKLIGLPTFYLKEGQQLNFAVPVEWVRQLPERHAAAIKNSETYKKRLDKFIELTKAEDYLNMLRLARAWAKETPDDSFALFVMGYAYSMLQHFDEALESLERSVLIKPTNVLAWNRLGIVYLEKKQLDKAVNAFKNAIYHEPDYYSAWTYLGYSYLSKNETQDAIEILLRSLEIKSSQADAWFYLGFSYRKQGEFARAIESFKQANTIDPSPSILYELGVTYFLDDQREMVFDVYRRLFVLDRDMAAKLYKDILVDGNADDGITTNSEKPFMECQDNSDCGPGTSCRSKEGGGTECR